MNKLYEKSTNLITGNIFNTEYLIYKMINENQHTVYIVGYQ